MLVDLHRLLQGRWSRYVVYKGYETPRCEGRVMSGYEAQRVVEGLLSERDAHQVRALYGRLTLLRHAPWGRDGAVNTVPALMADGTAG
jgi:hypothetical protein